MYKIVYMQNLEKWYRWSYLQSRNRDIDVEIKHMGTKGEGGGEMNWEIETDIYTVLHIKEIINENLLYSTMNSSHGSVVT